MKTCRGVSESDLEENFHVFLWRDEGCVPVKVCLEGQDASPPFLFCDNSCQRTNDFQDILESSVCFVVVFWENCSFGLLPKSTHTLQMCPVKV